jgi:hypothetical protein
MSPDKRRDFLREIANVMIRTGGYWLSIRHLQFMMPSTRGTLGTWSLMNRTKVYHEEVSPPDTPTATTEEINPWVHWIGDKPTPDEPSFDGKVLLYIHGSFTWLWIETNGILIYSLGGGFVLPLSSGHLSMMNTLLREAKTKSSKPIYLAIVEYSTYLHKMFSIIKSS